MTVEEKIDEINTKIDTLQTQLEDIDSKLDDLLGVEAEEDSGDMSDETEAKVKTLRNQRKSIVRQIDAQQDQLSRIKERMDLKASGAKARTEVERSNRAVGASGRITDPDKPARSGTRIEVKEPDFKSDPKGGFKTPREFLGCVMNAGTTGRMDERLKHRYHMTAGTDEARGNSDPAGGFLLPIGFSPDLKKVQAEADPVAALTTKMPMQLPTIQIPARVDKNHSTSVSGGLTWSRRPQTAPGSSSLQVFEQIQFTATNLTGLAYATEEMLSDSPISFIALLQSGFAEQLGAHKIEERLSGTGAGEPLGILKSACLVTVNKEIGQAVDTIVKENIDQMRSRCWGYEKSIWLANHNTIPSLRSLVQVIGVGGNAVPYFNVDANGNATLDGRPLVITEYAKSIGDVGDLILGNWSEYIDAEFEPMQNAESIHVRFVNHERCFKFWLRDTGAPWWRSALTPKNSTLTLSPFVVLQAR
jgi:HK97 family phage major capsid protein